MKKLVLLAACLLATPAFASDTISASFVASYLDPDKEGPTAALLQRETTVGGDVLAVSGNLGAGTGNSVKAQSSPWLNRIDITSDASAGFVYGAATSFWAVNQKVTGDAGSTATLTYNFKLTGNFAPGPANQYLPAGVVAPQNLTYYFLAYQGIAESVTAGSDAFGKYLLVETTAGDITLIRSPSTPGYVNTLSPHFAGRAACFGGVDTRCSAGGAFDDLFTLSFDMNVGEDFFLVGFLASETSGSTDFFNTARLVSIDLAPEFDLISGDGGALKRNADGSFGLAVPEPASWVMLIGGFGLVGGLQRRHRLARA
jgi:hypothetical protein